MARDTGSGTSLKYGIGHRLFFYILLFSLVITIIGASLHLYLEY